MSLDPSADPKPYHHGDLRAALIAAALDAIERGGAETLSLRELARTVGVSATAPYRHFGDRRALLIAVAAEGFRRLAVDYQAILSDPDLEGRRKARAFNRVFLALADEHPGLFQLMFESDLLTEGEAGEELLAVARAPFPMIWDAVQAAQPGLDPKWVKARVIAGWSALYGYVLLRRRGRLKPFMVEPLTDAELTEAVLDFIDGGESASGG